MPHFYNSSDIILLPHSVFIRRESATNIFHKYPLDNILSIRVLRRIVTIGSLYSEKLLLIQTVRARKYGSVGGSNGSFAMITHSTSSQSLYSSLQVSISPMRIVFSVFFLKMESIFHFHPESH